MGTPSAFPHGSKYSEYNGMTLRDWFAGQALASSSGWQSLPEFKYEEEARAFYAMADAMLKVRENK